MGSGINSFVSLLANPNNESLPASYDFGYYRPAAIGNYVGGGEDSDGRQEAGEPGLPNIRMFLKNCSTGTTLATTYTDAQGGYLFDNLAPGTYCVDVDETTGRARGIERLDLPGTE